MLSRVLVPASLVLPLAALAAQGGRGAGLVGLGRLYDASEATPLSDDVETVMGQPGYMVGVKKGRDAWPGVRFAAKSKPWDLSACAYVSATIYNNSLTPLTVSLRVEDAGSTKKGRWNEESATLAVGEWREIHAFFGYGDGFKKGYRLDASKVTGVTLSSKPDGVPKDGPRGLVVSHLSAEGTKGEKPTAKLPGFFEG